jgi:ribonuclease T2
MKKYPITLICSLLILASVSYQAVARSDYQASTNANCQLANKADSYKLAVSWQPAFCESHKGKPECKITDNKVYQASNFTLHGLWPNKRECGINYGLCGQNKQQVRSFCDYQPVPIKPETVKSLGEVMPSVTGGSCLERHEWYKHGTCQTDWNADGYFDTAVRLVKEFNQQGMAAFMKQNMGKTVETTAFLNAVNQAFGQNASQRISLACDRDGNLVDVFINLPKQIPANTALKDLIQQAPENFSNRCGKSFTVDAIGYSK